jgi:hypothetical protein
MQKFLRHRFGFVMTANAVLLCHGAADLRSVSLRFALAANIDGAVAHDNGTPGEIPTNAQPRSKLRGCGTKLAVFILHFGIRPMDDINCRAADKRN